MSPLPDEPIDVAEMMGRPFPSEDQASPCDRDRRDRWPMRAVMAIGEAVSKIMDERLAEHVRRYHEVQQ
jgi:hypothetical protein